MCCTTYEHVLQERGPVNFFLEASSRPVDSLHSLTHVAFLMRRRRMSYGTFGLPLLPLESDAPEGPVCLPPLAPGPFFIATVLNTVR